MKPTAANQTPRLILLCIIAIAGLFLYVGAYVINVRTLTPMWIMPAIAASIALATMPMLARRWQWLTGSDRPIYNALCHIYVAGALAYFAIAGGNYFFADSSTAVTEQATVTGRHTETRDTYRRIGRARHIKSGTTTTYYITLLHSDGTERDMQVTRQEYNHTRTGQQRTLTLQRGLLGFTVIKKPGS